MCTLSLIVPLHNVAKYLATTLESIAQQTLEAFEVILVDDGSTDETRDIAAQFSDQHPTWQLITQPQQGVSVARNIGTLRARGEYVAYLDGDDWLMPHTLQMLHTVAKQEQAELVQCGFYYAYEDYLLYDNRRQHPQDTPHVYDTEEALTALCQPHPTLNNFLWAKLMRRDIALAFPLPNTMMGEDAFVMHEIVARCQKIVVTPQPLWYYRQRRTGLSGTFTTRHIDLLKSYERRIHFCQQTDRVHLLQWVVPNYITQMFHFCKTAANTHNTTTYKRFLDYRKYAFQQYEPLIAKYASHLWHRLWWRHFYPIHLVIRIKNRLFHRKLMKLSYEESVTLL